MIEIAHFTGGNFRALSPALFPLPLMYAHSPAPVCILMCVKDGNNFQENECKYTVRVIGVELESLVKGGLISKLIFVQVDPGQILNTLHWDRNKICQFLA